MVLVSDRWPGQRLLRPFLGTGVLGGFTTFSTYALEVQKMVGAGAPRTARLGLSAVWVYLGAGVRGRQDRSR